MNKLKITIAAVALSLPVQALASVVTMTLVDEYETSGHKRVCVYEGGNDSATIVINAANSCPSKKTFGKQH